MVAVTKIDSNSTGLRYAQETSLGVLPGSPVWYPLEPNSYNDFGGDIKTVAREPINSSRQRQKGVTVDFDASGGFAQDFVFTEDFLRVFDSFFFAAKRSKGETYDWDSVAATSTYSKANAVPTSYLANDLIFADGFTNALNNGLKVVASVTGDDAIVVTAVNLVNEAAPPALSRIVRCGHMFVVSTLDVVADGTNSYPYLSRASGALDYTTLGLIPGEWIYIGDDSNSAYSFVNTANNGWARIHAITASTITLDKSTITMVDETGTGLTIRIFFGRVLKNESDPDLIVRKTLTLERDLGQPDTSSVDHQFEYLVGSVANQMTLNFKTADKITVDLSFIATDNVQYEAGDANPGETGSRPDLVSADAFNTSSDFSRLRMAILSDTDSAPSSLFAYLSDFKVTINNNASPTKAISVAGAFEVTVGNFTVEGDAEAYFSTVTAIQAVRNNEDITLDFALAKANKALVVDMPLIALGGGKPKVEKDQPIKLPLTTPAAADRVFNHTLLLSIFDYVPDVAF